MTTDSSRASRTFISVALTALVAGSLICGCATGRPRKAYSGDDLPVEEAARITCGIAEGVGREVSVISVDRKKVGSMMSGYGHDVLVRPGSRRLRVRWEGGGSSSGSTYVAPVRGGSFAGAVLTGALQGLCAAGGDDSRKNKYVRTLEFDAERATHYRLRCEMCGEPFYWIERVSDGQLVCGQRFEPESLDRLTEPQIHTLRRLRSDEFWAAAMHRTTNTVLFATLALDCDSNKLSCQALRQVDDQMILARVAKESPFSRARLDAVAKLEDQDTLKEVLQTDESNMVRRVAVRRVDDQNALAEAARSDKSPSIRQRAIERLNRIDLLEQLAQNPPDPKTARYAEKRLKRLRKAQQK